MSGPRLRREIPTWFAILALGLPLAFFAWAGCSGPALSVLLP